MPRVYGERPVADATDRNPGKFFSWVEAAPRGCGGEARTKRKARFRILRATG